MLKRTRATWTTNCIIFYTEFVPLARAHPSDRMCQKLLGQCDGKNSTIGKNWKLREPWCAEKPLHVSLLPGGHPQTNYLSCRLCSAPHSDVAFSSTILVSNALRQRLQRDLVGEKARHAQGNLGHYQWRHCCIWDSTQIERILGILEQAASGPWLRYQLFEIPNNLPCSSSAEILSRWIQFFADMEGGERVPFSEASCRLGATALWVQWTGASAVHLMTSQVWVLLRRLAVESKQARQMDPMQSQLNYASIYPVETAKMMYALMLKLVTHGHEPLLHKGGTVIPIWKGKLSKDMCEAYRSILLSSTLGKVIHRTLRVHQRDIYEAYLHAQQLGGRCHVPVTLGAHQTRAFVRWHRECGHPTAVLFVDLQEAFYIEYFDNSHCRGSFGDEALAKLAQRLGLGPWHLTWTLAASPRTLRSWLELVCLPVRSELCVRCTPTRTFSSHSKMTMFRHPSALDRAMPMQISVFGFLLARVLHFIWGEAGTGHMSYPLSHDRMEWSCSMWKSKKIAPECRFLGPVWMDDMALCLWSETNTGLKTKIGVATSLLLDIFREHAMTPNLRPGKTELMVSHKRPRHARMEERRCSDPSQQSTFQR